MATETPGTSKVFRTFVTNASRSEGAAATAGVCARGVCDRGPASDATNTRTTVVRAMSRTRIHCGYTGVDGLSVHGRGFIRADLRREWWNPPVPAPYLGSHARDPRPRREPAARCRPSTYAAGGRRSRRRELLN